jgi:predicted amidohydrolase
VRQLIAAAEPKAGDLIVLAEMFATGFSKNLDLTQEPSTGPTSEFLRALAAETRCCVIGGLVGSGSSGLGQNLALAVSPAGLELGRYVKQQPFSLGGECTVHESGTIPCLFYWGGMRVSPLICYDLRFPELARAAVRQGAEVLIYIASWPIKRAQHWVTLLQARAIENQAWVIGVNRCGTDPEFVYPGRSLVVDPHGNIVVDAADREGVVSCRVEDQIVRQWRADFPALRDAGFAA